MNKSITNKFSNIYLYIKDEAMSKIPMGRAHKCLDSSELPTMFKKIFTSQIDKS